MKISNILSIFGDDQKKKRAFLGLCKYQITRAKKPIKSQKSTSYKSQIRVKSQNTLTQLKPMGKSTLDVYPLGIKVLPEEKVYVLKDLCRELHRFFITLHPFS